MELKQPTRDEIQSFMVHHSISWADLAHELGVCEMSARNKVKGKSAFNKLELEKLYSLMHKEAN